jgi:glycosyltransferase involved in cell wall biosynthesis
MHDDWRAICDVLYGAERPLLWRSLKIPIYGAVTGKFDSRFRYVVKYFLRQLTTFDWKRVPEAGYDFVFLLPYNSPSNRNNLLPVVRYCVSSSLKTLLILGEGFGDAASGSEWPECDIVRIEDFQGYPGIRKKLSIAFSAPGTLLGIFKGFRGLPSVRTALLRNAIGMYYHVFSALVFRSVFDMLFERISARHVVTTSDLWPFENQFIWAAKEAGLKTYVIQHGIIVEYWWPFDSDYLFLWGDLHREHLVGLGAPEERILIGGMPALDDKPKTRADSIYRAGRPLNVLIISQTQARDISDSFMGNFVSCLKVLGERDDRFRVVVKLHPIENMSFYVRHALDRLPNFTFVRQERGIHDCIIESDLCISLFSTGGLEAVALNRPSIVLNLERWIEDYAWWPRYGGGVYVSDVQAFRNVLENILKDPGYLRDILEKQELFLHRSFSNVGTACREIVHTASRCSAGVPSATGISV